MWAITEEMATTAVRYLYIEKWPPYELESSFNIFSATLDISLYKITKVKRYGSTIIEFLQ